MSMEATKYGNPRAVVQIGWKDALWLDEHTKADLLKSCPPFLREAVIHGTPSLGSGAIYPVSLDDVVLKPTEVGEIPAYYKRVYAVDVGWNRTAACFLAINPDDDVAYAYSEYYGTKQEPEIHAARIRKTAGDTMPGVIDPAGRQRSQQDGTNLMKIYNKLGLRLRVADNSIDAGINEVWSRLSSGRLKFYPNTPNLQNEYLIYRRDQDGKIIKEHDHLMDALRYAVMAIPMARAVTPDVLRTQSPNGNRFYNV
jgi:hypothetical protein